MEIIKAGITGAKPAELVGKSEHVEKAMTGNAAFSTPTPTLPEIADARKTLVEAIADAEGGAHAAIATKNAAARKLAQMLVALSRYVNSVAAGDVQMGVSSGFELRRKPDPIDKLEAPSKFESRTGNIAGQVTLRWKGVRGGRLYRVYICEGDPLQEATWRPLDYASKGSYTVTELVTDRKYAFRVSALGVVGEGPSSEVVTAKAA